MAIENKAKQRLAAYKARRDDKAVAASLENVARACEALKAGTGSLMPALIEAARAGATNGEMMGPVLSPISICSRRTAIQWRSRWAPDHYKKKPH